LEDMIRQLAEKHLFSIDAVNALHEVYGSHLEKVIKTLRRPSQTYFMRVNTLKTTSKEVVDRFQKRNVQVWPFGPIEEAIYTRITGPFEIPKVEKKIVIDRFAAESVLQGAHVYAPAVMRCSKLRLGDEVTITDIRNQVVGVGTMKMGETDILNLRKGLAVEVVSPIFRTLNLRESPEYEEGLVYPQSLPAMVTTRVLDPKPGETIVDLNCSPGGKLSHISQLMRNTGRVFGVDRNPRKIKIAKDNIERLGCRNVTLISHDARYFDVDYPGLKADKCLVDPPCSALGLTPKLYVEISERKIQDLAAYQKQFLKAAIGIVKDGGSIVYSVCTVTKDECEDVVRYGVEELGLEVTEQNIRVGEGGLKVLGDIANLLQRFDPQKDGIGYFVARFIKSKY